MDKNTLESLAKEALEAFWKSVVERYPQAKSGDSSPLTTRTLDRAAEAAIGEWIEHNVRVACRTCGSEIVATINDSSFNDGECGGCEYQRYRSQPALLEECEINLGNWQMFLHHEWDGSNSGVLCAIERLQAVINQAHGNKS